VFRISRLGASGHLDSYDGMPKIASIAESPCITGTMNPADPSCSRTPTKHHAMIQKATILVSLALHLSACDQAKQEHVTATRERSQAVFGAAPAPTVTSAPQAVVAATAKTPRKLCGGTLSSKGAEISTEVLSRRMADGERELPERIDLKSQFTWINFWAAWCGPCKEEIPLLVEWEKKLKADGVDFKLVFVSLDDDERQLTSFLSQQPTSGLRRSYWLTEGVNRVDWLGKVGMKAAMELPAHLIVDSSGSVRCKVQGAIDASDYSQLREMLHGSR